MHELKKFKMQNTNYKLKFKNNKGYALLIMTAMISLLAITVMTCAFVLSHEVNKDERYDITRQRMLEVKRALIGRLADVSGGENITSCGGFISDYGELGTNPGDIDNFINNNFIPVLLDEPDVYPDWQYDGGNQFWAGYRVEALNDGCYLKAPPAQPNPTTEFLDGWGYQIEANFVDDNGNGTIEAGENKIAIKSKGDDNLWDTDPGADTIYYGKDIIDTFYWRRPQADVAVTNNSPNPNASVRVELIYAWQGGVQLESQDFTFALIGETLTANFTDAAHGAKGIPVGLRKAVISEVGPPVVVKIIKMFCLPSGNGTYTLEEIGYSG